MTVTIDLNEDAVNTPGGWTRVNARKFTKTYSANASETVTFTDAAGNTGTANVVVTNIDKASPVANVGYSTTALTNQDVTVTISLNKDSANTPAGWTRVDARTFTKTYSSNASETVTFTDAAGNTGTASVVVNNIDKVAVSSCDFVGAAPTEQATTYSGLVLGCNKNLSGATISAITSSAGGNISAISINGQGRIVFTLTTPNAPVTQLRVQGTDAAGNAIDVTRTISVLTIWNTGSITGTIHDSASSEPDLQKFDIKPFMISTSGVTSYAISGDLAQYVTIDNNGIVRIKDFEQGDVS